MRQMGGMLLLLGSAVLFGMWSASTTHVVGRAVATIVFLFAWGWFYVWLDHARWKEFLR